MTIRNDQDAINLGNSLLKSYPPAEFNLPIKNKIPLSYRVIGTRYFQQRIRVQLKEIMQKSAHGQLLLAELASLPKTIDFIEYKASHTAFHAGQYQKADFFKPHCNTFCSWTGGPWKLAKSALERGAVHSR